jgi:hypothetical protein
MGNEGKAVSDSGLLGSVAGISVGIGVRPAGRLCGAVQAVKNKIMKVANTAILDNIFSVHLVGSV